MAAKHHGNVECHSRILAEEFRYARTWTSKDQPANSLKVYNYLRPHSAAGKPASRLHTGVTNVRTSYTWVYGLVNTILSSFVKTVE